MTAKRKIVKAGYGLTAKEFVKKQVKNTLYILAGAAVIIAVWLIAAKTSGLPSMLLPTPYAALKALFNELKSAYFWKSYARSLFRSVMAFLFSLIAALILVFAGRALPPLKKILSPIVGVLRAVPTMSVILFLVILLTREITPVIVSGLVIFPVLYGGIDGALAAVPVELSETARLYGANKAYAFFNVYLPLAAPSFMYTAGGAISLSVKLTVAAEVLAQTPYSLGIIMQQTRISYDMGRLMAITVAVIVTSLLLEFIAFIVRKAVEY